MTQNEWGLLRELVQTKSLALMRHESKNFAKVGLDLSKYREIVLDGRRFFTIATHVFTQILYEVFPKAHANFREAFGRYRTDLIIEAIYKTEPWGNLEDFANFLSNEQFVWVFEMVDGTINPQVLRIDLFRKTSLSGDGSSEFTGGVVSCV